MTADGARVAYSPGWEVGPTPRIAAVVSSFRRATFLEGLLAALTTQTLDPSDFEVVVVDNGSGDETWERLVALAAASPARLAVASLPTNRGPGGGRNHGLGLVRAPLAAITDDDCLPTPGWLEAMLEAAASGADVVQGQVQADPATRDTAGPWDHVKWITAPTPFFETCNVAYRLSSFHKVGGFDEDDPLTAQFGGRAFGEDALVAWRMVEAGAQQSFWPDALVYHRVIPAGFAHWLRDQRNLVGFPGLGARSPLVAEWFWHRYFLTKETARFDLAVAGVAGAVCARRPWLALAAIPWAAARLPHARRLAGADRRQTPLRLAQLTVGDVVSLISLVEGTVRHRRLLL